MLLFPKFDNLQLQSDNRLPIHLLAGGGGKAFAIWRSITRHLMALMDNKCGVETLK